ncbi:MAG TPA: calcium/sodium antiporter [Candidatus Hydrogenedentes bacterium]|nr:calcium/sodium antiporter [Candidatus Hydrogenedentota bacterium]HQH51907.1 calcium/sodium antiporter [Candidatus Hydrogenedentota bacterium]
MYLVILIAGLTLLVAGAELLVRGASRLAAMARISPLIIGLTVVAYGTSVPELAVSAHASLAGEAGLAVGNVVGSNIFNVLLILGIAAIVRPLAVSARLVRLDVPIMIGTSLLLWALSANGVLGRGEGVLLLVSLVAYTAVLGILSKRYAKQQENTTPVGAPAQDPVRTRYLAANAALVLLGLSGLVFGARWFMEGAIEVAERLGVSHVLIGLTIVAAGTSLPELFTSVWASIRGQRDIAVGNVIGSNIFNLLGVLGLSAVLGQGGLEVSRDVLRHDVLVMVAASIACLPIFISGATVSRIEGVLLVFYYGLYVTVLILDAIKSPMERPVSEAVAFLFLPMTALVLVMSIFISEKHLERILGPFADNVEITTKRTLRQLKRLLIFTIGGTLVLIGLVMILLPGPATIVIPLGMGILATEFIWAKRLLVNTMNRARHLVSAMRNMNSNE